VPVLKPSTEASVELPKRDLDKSMAEKVGGLFSSEPDTQPTTKPAGEPAPAESNEKGFFDF
jgi:outer membrane protein assembly factor BamE